MGAPLQHDSCSSQPRRAAPSLSPSLRSNLLTSKCCSSLLSFSGGAELWTAEPCRIFHTVRVDQPYRGRTFGLCSRDPALIKICSWESQGDQDLFVGEYTFTLLQLSINSSAAREV